MMDAVPAALLLRDSVLFYLRARLAAGVATGGDASPSSTDLAAGLPTVPADSVRPKAEPTDDARVRAALVATDPGYFDDLSPEDAARARVALERTASMVGKTIEARSLTNLRGTRWGRALAVALLFAYGAIVGIRAAVLPKNIALHKPVIPSSIRLTPTHEQTITDGDLGFSYGIHTGEENSPSVVIDLLDRYRIRDIKVYNRRDGWWDWCLPLVVEVSTDGQNYKEIGRREESFAMTAPWEIKVAGEPARYVRLRIAHRGELALSEVEVFGKRM